jgi:uncharacterized membrane protein YhaH (DUF805 family)
MQGNVIGFDPDTNTGAISGHDGNRYDFATIDWRGRGQPRHGDVVDFQPDRQHATQIYLLEPEYVAPSFGRFYFSAAGRISRAQYWLRFIVPYFAITMVLQIIAAISGIGSVINTTISVILLIFSLIAIWPSFAVLIKRMHDRNKSGWYILFIIIPAVIFAFLLFAWIGALIIAAAAGEDVTTAAGASLGIFGVLVIIFGMVVLGLDIWFFVEFGCLRGTIGANRFGPDPVR